MVTIGYEQYEATIGDGDPLRKRDRLHRRLTFGVVDLDRVGQQGHQGPTARGDVERGLAPVTRRAAGHVPLVVEEDAKLPLARVEWRPVFTAPSVASTAWMSGLTGRCAHRWRPVADAHDAATPAWRRIYQIAATGGGMRVDTYPSRGGATATCIYSSGSV